MSTRRLVLVAFTAADEGSFAEGILQDAGAVAAKSVESPDEPKREGATSRSSA